MDSVAAVGAAHVGSIFGSSLLSIVVVGVQSCGIAANSSILVTCAIMTELLSSKLWTFTAGPLKVGGFGMGSRSMHGRRARDQSCAIAKARLGGPIAWPSNTKVPVANRLVTAKLC